MGKIPADVTPEESENIEHYLSKAERGSVCKIPLYKMSNRLKKEYKNLFDRPLSVFVVKIANEIIQLV